MTIDLDWRKWPEVKRLQSVLEKHNIEYAFLGGAVRDMQLGRLPNDIDILADIHQDDAYELMVKEGYITTKLHARTATVRVRSNPRPFDIVGLLNRTTKGTPFIERLTDQLVNNSDMGIVAVALMPDGRFIDPCGGMEDLKMRRVRFLAHAAEIMSKSAVRIIRFYRMHAIYAAGEPDAFSVSVCKKNAPYLRDIDGSQYIRDFLKWVVVPKLSDSIELMRSHGVMDYVFPLELKDISPLIRLEKLEAMTGTLPDVEVRFPLLLRSTGISPYTALEKFQMFCKYHGPGFEVFLKLLDLQPLTTGLSASIVEYVAGTHGKDIARKLILFSWAQDIDAQARAQQFMPMLKQYA